MSQELFNAGLLSSLVSPPHSQSETDPPLGYYGCTCTGTMSTTIPSTMTCSSALRKARARARASLRARALPKPGARARPSARARARLSKERHALLGSSVSTMCEESGSSDNIVHAAIGHNHDRHGLCAYTCVDQHKKPMHC